MKIVRNLVLIFASIYAGVCAAQQVGEEFESTPEQLDEAFNAQDAVREAARWSNVVSAPDKRTPLERMTDAADLIFYGTVQSQEVLYEGNDIPFTHTTFVVTNLIKGETDGAAFTLVQEGGPDRHIPHKVMLSSTSHYFALGEEELLFVTFDKKTGTDMVQQRFRVMQGNMYSENGRGVIVASRASDNKPALQLTRGRSADKRFRTVPLGSSALYKQFSDDKPNTDAGQGATARQALADTDSLGSSVGDFIAAVSRQRGAQQ